jgi:hypothetical protein
MATTLTVTVEKLLQTPEETAEVIGHCETRVRQWHADGTLPGGVRINGGPLRFSYDALRRWSLEQAEAQAAEAAAERKRVEEKIERARGRHAT